MKANHPASLFPSSVGFSLWAATALTALLAACASPPPPPSRPVPRPRPAYAPSPPAPRVQPPLGWRDAPITPGNWRWSRINGSSSARFAEGPNGPGLEFRCDRAAGVVLLIRSATVEASSSNERTPLTVTTTSTARALTAQPLGGPRPAIVVSLPARDPLLDAIIFSRGRFGVEARGLVPIYAPTWPEIARVVEDCR
jgi:hypothetical protein